MAEIRMTVTDDDENAFQVYPGAENTLSIQGGTDDLHLTISDEQILELIKTLLIYQYKPLNGMKDEEFLERAIAMLETFLQEAEAKLGENPAAIDTPLGRLVSTPLERLKGYCLSASKHPFRAVKDESGEIQGYWQTTEWIDGLLAMVGEL